jgi:hypothetical protein
MGIASTPSLGLSTNANGGLVGPVPFWDEGRNVPSPQPGSVVTGADGAKYILAKATGVIAPNANVILTEPAMTVAEGAGEWYSQSTAIPTNSYAWFRASIQGGGVAAAYLPTVGSSPAGAYGLNKLIEAWAGLAVRVRNAGGTEQDIGFVGNTFDAANAFLTSGGPFTVTTVYDQTGGGKHLTQPTVANQPTLWLGEDGPTINDYTGTHPMLIPASLSVDKGNCAVFMVTRTPGNGATDGYFAWGTAAVDFGLTSPRTGGQTALQPMVAGTSLNATVANARAMPINNDSITGLVSSAAKIVVHRDEQTAEYATTASAVQNSGGQVGEAITYDGRNDWRSFVVYPAALSDADTLAVKTAFKTIFDTAGVAGEYWLFQGDSIIFGTGGSNNRTISAAIEFRSPKTTLFRNRGIAGHQLSQHYQDYDVLSPAWVYPGVTNLYVADYGHNDIKDAVTDAATALSVVATMKTQLQAMTAKMRAYWNAQNTPLIIIWQETLPDVAVGWTAFMESARDAWNAWLRTNPIADDGLPCLDALDTLASDNSFVLSDFETDVGRGMAMTVNSSDGIHPNESMAPARAIKVMATKSAIPMLLRYAPVTTANQGSTYTGYTPQVVLGTAPFTYSIQAGTLPTGLSLNPSTGVISGTPTTIETKTGIVLRVTASNGATADSTAFQIAVSAAQQVVIASTTVSQLTTDGTAFNILLPATVNAGDILLIVMTNDGNSAITWDNTTAGTWTANFNDVQTANRLLAYSRISDGSEGGKTLAITIAAAQQAVAFVRRYTGVQGTMAFTGTGNRGTGTSPDPTAITAPWGTANNLYEVFLAIDNYVPGTITPPTGYGNLQTQTTSASGQATLAAAYKSASSSSDDPSAWTIPSLGYVSLTVAVRPS